ncbi:MAG TPA: cell division protein ZapA [Stellaceae bacterium]|nr:cell division protein ZapA [Stellaceae bacterium]
MPQVNVTINGRAYAVQCDPGEEHRIRELARIVDAKTNSFSNQALRAGEARILVMAALVLADELAEANDALRRLNARAAASADDPALADGIERLARRIEVVASRLETSHI